MKNSCSTENSCSTQKKIIFRKMAIELNSTFKIKFNLAKPQTLNFHHKTLLGQECIRPHDCVPMTSVDFKLISQNRISNSNDGEYTE